MSEIENHFGTNPHRLYLLSGFKRGAQALAKAGCRILYLDGSFVTDKEFPSDYDVCWEEIGVVLAHLDPVLQVFGNKRAAQKAKYFGEYFPAHGPAENDPPFRIFFDFFQTDKDTGQPKGIIAINLV
jgi:hypothetical protein